MREKLIELIREAFQPCEMYRAMLIADHLIANGVVVLPCKIGDDIWWIDAETYSVECEKNGVTGFIIKKDEILIRDRTGGEDHIGTQYCYLSKEDAEKALEEA